MAYRLRDFDCPTCDARLEELVQPGETVRCDCGARMIEVVIWDRPQSEKRRRFGSKMQHGQWHSEMASVWKQCTRDEHGRL